MERPPHVQKAHASTADLLNWTVTPSEARSVGSGHAFHSGARSHQPSDDIRKALSGGQTTEDGSHGVNRRGEDKDQTLPTIVERLAIIEGDLQVLKDDMSIIKGSVLEQEDMLKRVCGFLSSKNIHPPS